MTQKGSKCDFADNFVSEQARAEQARARPECSLWSLEYNTIPFGPLRTILEVKN